MSTDIDHWRDVSTGVKPNWDSRSKVIAQFIRPDDIVLDLGAGDQKLKGHIPQSCGYLPVDCHDAQPDTFVVDLNEEFRLPSEHFNVIVSAGFVEHISELPLFMHQLATQCEGKLMLMTLSSSWQRGRIKQSGKEVRHNLFETSAESLEWFAPYLGDLNEVVRLPTGQSLFIGTLSYDAKRGPHAPRLPAIVAERPVLKRVRKSLRNAQLRLRDLLNPPRRANKV